MNKIESMTPEQERLMVEFREEYRAIGLSCEPADRKRAEAAITEIYTAIGKGKPLVFWFDGLMVAELALNFLNGSGDNFLGNLRDNLWGNLRGNLWDNLEDNLEDNLWGNLRGNLWDNLRSNLRVNLLDNLVDNLVDNLEVNLADNLADNLWDNLRDNLAGNLWDNLWDNLRDNLWGNLRDNLWGNLRGNLEDNLRDNLRSNLRSNLLDNKLKYFNTWLWGQMDAYWIAWYLFPHLHLRKMHTDEQMQALLLWDELCRSCCWWWSYENICVMSERPLEIHMTDMRLHCNDGPAFVSRDGWRLWYLNGVHVTQEIVETPARELDPRIVLTERNAEVRREIVRKIGVERLCIGLNAQCIDRSGDYELLMLDLQDSRTRPYLKMLNPSLDGVFHIEGVHPECDSVEKAIAWRNGVDVGEAPITLT